MLERVLPPSLLRPLVAAPLLFAPVGGAVLAQDQVPTLRVGALPDGLRLDGRLDEEAWAAAPAIENLTMVEPREGAVPTLRTEVRVLANRAALVIGVRCFDSSPSEIVSYAVARDSSLGGEDHVRIVLGTFRDGRTGYVFGVNPGGARYDALVASRGEGENSSWDGLWEAATHRDEEGWSIELRIPVRTLNFKEGMDSWDFNVERKVQRLLERHRWAGAQLDRRVTQTSHAGLLTGLPAFDLGRGLAVRPAMVLREGKTQGEDRSDWDVEPSLDVSWKPTPDFTVQFTANTDFAETEVDTRRTNLTRFPTFFPEKRAFFLEGADAFDFGFGLGQNLVPYHSRRIGLVRGDDVPLLFGAKAFGRFGGTSVGAITAQTGHEGGVAPSEAMGVVRVRQDILEESTVGMIATGGDPRGRGGSYMAGADFTYQTSHFQGDKNFLAGVWGLTMDRDELEGDSRSAWGGKLDYPNDLWDVAFVWNRIGEDFDPSLGFVPRRGIRTTTMKAEYAPRPEWNFVRQAAYEFYVNYITDLDKRWETYRLTFTPINWEFESGDQVEAQVIREGDRPEEEFDVGEDVFVAPGTYEWTRWEIKAESASKRRISAEVGFETGDFYDGTLDTYAAEIAWNPMALLTFELDAERNVGELADGKFSEDAYGGRVRFNISPDMTYSSYVQYDTESDSLGTNNRFRWTITPASDLFIVFNYNWHVRGSSWIPESHDTAIKIQYEVRL